MMPALWSSTTTTAVARTPSSATVTTTLQGTPCCCLAARAACRRRSARVGGTGGERYPAPEPTVRWSPQLRRQRRRSPRPPRRVRFRRAGTWWCHPSPRGMRSSRSSSVQSGTTSGVVAPCPRSVRSTYPLHSSISHSETRSHDISWAGRSGRRTSTPASESTSSNTSWPRFFCLDRIETPLIVVGVMAAANRFSHPPAPARGGAGTR